MGWGGVGRRGWPDVLDNNVSANQQPQWIGAGAWEPLSTNTYLLTTPQEFTGAGDIAFTTLRFNKGSSDEWFCTVAPPVNWTSEKLKFIPHYLVVDSLGTPQSMIFELGAEYMPDGFLPNVTTAWQNMSSDKTPGSATIPQYIIGTESAELTVSGSPSSTGAVGLRLRRGTDVESDPLYFVGLKLIYV